MLIHSVQQNLGHEAVTDVCGFKHWFVPEQILFPMDVMVVVIARDPYDWIRSLHANPWHAHPSLKTLDFAAFIRAEWHSYWDSEFGGVADGHPVLGREMLHERCPHSGRRFDNALAKRTAKLRQWSGLRDRAMHVALLDYATFRASPDAVIAALADAAGLARTRPFVAERSYKGQGFFPFTPTDYPPIDPDDGQHIRQWLDPAVEARFGFALGTVDDQGPTETPRRPIVTPGPLI